MCLLTLERPALCSVLQEEVSDPGEPLLLALLPAELPRFCLAVYGGVLQLKGRLQRLLEFNTDGTCHGALPFPYDSAQLFLGRPGFQLRNFLMLPCSSSSLGRCGAVESGGIIWTPLIGRFRLDLKDLKVGAVIVG